VYAGPAPQPPTVGQDLYVRSATAGFSVIAIHACRAPAIAAVVKDTKSAKAKAQKAFGREHIYAKGRNDLLGQKRRRERALDFAVRLEN
jgi:hypothetical protein